MKTVLYGLQSWHREALSRAKVCMKYNAECFQACSRLGLYIQASNGNLDAKQVLCVCVCVCVCVRARARVHARVCVHICEDVGAF